MPLIVRFQRYLKCLQSLRVPQLSLTDGALTTVDTFDFVWAAAYTWSPVVDRVGNKYAARYVSAGPYKSKRIYLHNEVANVAGLLVPKGFVVDHLDRNPLNNSRSNLEPKRKTENLWNAGKARAARLGLPLSSKFKGVSWYKGVSWLVRISHENKLIHVGYFKTEVEAALAYDRKVVELRGRFAVTNKSLGLL